MSILMAEGDALASDEKLMMMIIDDIMIFILFIPFSISNHFVSRRRTAMMFVNVCK